MLRSSFKVVAVSLDTRGVAGVGSFSDGEIRGGGRRTKSGLKAQGAARPHNSTTLSTQGMRRLITSVMES